MEASYVVRALVLLTSLGLYPLMASAHVTASASIGSNDAGGGIVTASARVERLGPGVSGAANASGSLATGLLRAQVGGATGPGPGTSQFAMATVTAGDMLRLVPLAPGTTTPVAVTTLMDVTGTLSINGIGDLRFTNEARAVAQGVADLSIVADDAIPAQSGAHYARDLRRASSGFQGQPVALADIPRTLGAINALAVETLNHFSARLTARAQVRPDAWFSIVASLTAFAEADPAFVFEADLGHTARLSIVVPEGFVLQSASGVFLVDAVPLPAAWLLLAAPLAGLRARRLAAPAESSKTSRPEKSRSG